MKISDHDKESEHRKIESDEISLKNFTREKYQKNESPDDELAEEKSRLLPGNETKLMICFCANMVLKHKIEILIELG